MDEIVLVYTTWPDAETAELAARQAVEAGLAACANILGPIASIYAWEGALQREVETPMLLKTSVIAADALRALIIRIHPHKVPCVVAIGTQVAGSNPAFFNWIVEQTRSGAAEPGG